MRFVAVATDYDGTIAHDGRVEADVLSSFEAVRASGRKLILVTGRHLPDLFNVFPQVALFDRVVAENGVLLYNPATRKERLLVEPISEKFVRALRDREVSPLSVGRGIVATRQPHEIEVLEAIKDLGLDLQVIFNKGAVMVLPSGTNKGTGLQAVLRDMKLAAHNVVGLGDAENDHAFLRLCGCSVAVANALPAVKERVDIVTQGEDGRGAREILEALLANDLSAYESSLKHKEGLRKKSGP